MTAADATAAAPAPSRADQRCIAVACVIGNFLEYFEFAIYGFFAVAIGATFFPTATATSQLLAVPMFGLMSTGNALLVLPALVIYGILQAPSTRTPR